MDCIGSRIKMARKRKGLSVQNVADFCNVTRPTVYAMEGDKSNPQIKVLLKLCDLFKVDLESIVFGKNRKVKNVE